MIIKGWKVKKKNEEWKKRMIERKTRENKNREIRFFERKFFFPASWWWWSSSSCSSSFSFRPFSFLFPVITGVAWKFFTPFDRRVLLSFTWLLLLLNSLLLRFSSCYPSIHSIIVILTIISVPRHSFFHLLLSCFLLSVHLFSPLLWYP